MDTLKIAIIQIQTGSDKKANLEKTESLFSTLKNEQVDLVLLPEMFQCAYDLKAFPLAAENIPSGDTCFFLSRLACEYGVYLIGGSIPEKDGDQYFNTATIYAPSGEFIGRYRKIHLFDVDFENLRFQESAILTPGDTPLLVDTPWGKIGIMICYDLRFPELSRLYTLRGANIIAVPAAFNNVTGPMHWEVLFRARAIDNQLFLLGASPAPLPDASYHAYGHSLIVDPLGHILGQLNEQEAILIREISLTAIPHARQRLPLLQHRRRDLYALSPEEKLGNGI